MASQTKPASASLGRLPKYLAYLKIQQKQGVQSISSTRIATDLRLYPVQVRKDLALASQCGRPKTGYPLDTLIADLEDYLGYNNAQDAFLVGAGRLGRALLCNKQFTDYGLNILAGFDSDPALHGIEVDGKPIFSLQKLPNLAQRMRVTIAVLTVPNEAAQETCNLLCESGFRAIWSFATIPLDVPEHVILQSENLAASFATLSARLSSAVFK